MKYYYVSRTGGAVRAWVCWDDGAGGGDGYRLPHLTHHSPDGFEYGYGGSGPSDLARSIVGDLLNTDEPDPRLYQELKWAWVALLDGDGPFKITEDEIRAIIGQEIEEETASTVAEDAF